MPGHRVDAAIFKDQDHWKKYLCPKCQLLLKDAVQPSCGHWLCQTCADLLFNESSPQCPKEDCGETLTSEEGACYFPDRFVRKEILGLSVFCQNKQEGCSWEGKFSDLEGHLNSECSYSYEECKLCHQYIPTHTFAAHKLECTAGQPCPCAQIGCSNTSLMTKPELENHIADQIVEHMTYVVDEVTKVKKAIVKTAAIPKRTEADGYSSIDDDYLSKRHHRHDLIETDGPEPVAEEPFQANALVPKSKTEFQTDARVYSHDEIHDEVMPRALKTTQLELSTFREEIEGSMKNEMRKKDEDIAGLRMQVTKLEKQIRAKNTEIEDRDFRLSLIENSSYDGNMVWKIPQFSQRMTDAENGKYTSIFSLPFYTSRYGFKMCLRLYILGDGIGKNTHMSLFFVIMRGEFDNILQWPFTHKVTFKLLNQTGGRDILDTFQPDPMSSSFKKPKSDMNIASGCPRFVSHQDLKNGGFVLDDTIFIKCTIDKSAIRNP